jgi:AcrR family transcriptional regulator
MDVKGGGRQAERSEATRGELIRVARELFAERGYAGVGTEEIVKAAQVTRGALYHHFDDKKDLFRAVHTQGEEDLTSRIAVQLQAAGDDPYEVLLTGLRTFLEACTDPAVAQIALLDAPSVLGWQEWREIDERYGLGLVTLGLQAAMDSGALREQPVKPLAHMFLGALGEAGMVIAHSADREAARAEVEPALVSLLEGLRAD